MLEQKNIFNYNDRKILLLCHPRSGSSCFVREFYRFHNSEEYIDSELLYLSDKINKPKSFNRIKRHTIFSDNEERFKKLDYNEQTKLVKSECLKFLKNNENVIFKIFFRNIEELFSKN